MREPQLENDVAITTDKLEVTRNVLGLTSEPLGIIDSELGIRQHASSAVDKENPVGTAMEQQEENNKRNSNSEGDPSGPRDGGPDISEFIVEQVRDVCRRFDRHGVPGRDAVFALLHLIPQEQHALVPAAFALHLQENPYATEFRRFVHDQDLVDRYVARVRHSGDGALMETPSAAPRRPIEGLPLSPDSPVSMKPTADEARSSSECAGPQNPGLTDDDAEIARLFGQGTVLATDPDEQSHRDRLQRARNAWPLHPRSAPSRRGHN